MLNLYIKKILKCEKDLRINNLFKKLENISGKNGLPTLCASREDITGHGTVSDIIKENKCYSKNSSQISIKDLSLLKVSKNNFREGSGMYQMFLILSQEYKRYIKTLKTNAVEGIAESQRTINVIVENRNSFFCKRKIYNPSDEPSSQQGLIKGNSLNDWPRSLKKIKISELISPTINI